jgi:hypothetical protein
MRDDDRGRWTLTRVTVGDLPKERLDPAALEVLQHSATSSTQSNRS